MKKFLLFAFILALFIPYGSAFATGEVNDIPENNTPASDTLVTFIKLDKPTATLLRSQILQLTATITPANATVTDLAWTSSNESIAKVSDDGTVTPVGCGTVTITCTSTDGSEKRASCEVFIPTISIPSTDMIIASQEGIKIPLDFYGKELRVASNSEKFVFDFSIKSLYVWPKAAGEGTIILTDTNNAKENRVVITVAIAPSAVFDTSSYTARDIGTMAPYMRDYLGEKISVTGTVVWTELAWQEGDGALDYGHRLLLVENTAQTGNDPKTSLYKSYLVKIPVIETFPTRLDGDRIQIYGTIARGKSNTMENYNSTIALSAAQQLQRWNFLAREIGLSQDQNPDINDSFFYIDAAWICFVP